MSDVLQVKFTHSNTVRDKRPYTIYEIEVRSSSTITWVIYKRYSDFYALHQELLKSQTVASSFTGKQPAKGLPHLPPKRLTRSLAVEFVEKRKQELQDYLRELLANPAHFTNSNVLINFLEVPDSVRPMIANSRNAGGAGGAGAHPGAFPGFDLKDVSSDAKESLLNAKNNYAHNSPEERRVLELINLLKHHPNKVAAVKSFEEYFFDQRPRLSAEYIRLLFQGKNGADGEGGLIQTCGDFGYSHVASRAALYLLCRLLDVEKNKDAQLFVDQFVSLEVNVLRKMQLHLHILSERGNRLGAFRIVSIIRNNSGTASSAAGGSGGMGSKPGDASIEQIVSDQWARQEYLKWAERKTDQVAPYSHEPQDKQLKALSLNEVPYKQIAQQSFADLIRVNADQDGWRLVADPAAAANGQPPQAQYQVAGMGAAEDVRITYKTDTSKDLVTVKVTTVLPYPIDSVVQLLIDLRKRKLWDVKFHRGKRIAKLDATSDVAHLIFRSFSSPYKYRDFCLLRTYAKAENGSYLLAARSILHPNGPEYKDNVRAVLFPSGYLLTPVPVSVAAGKPAAAAAPGATAAPAPAAATTKPGTALVFIAQMDRESVLIVSPDLLGETAELRRSFQAMRAVLANPNATTSASGYVYGTGASSSSQQQQLQQQKLLQQQHAAAAAAAAGASPSILSSLSTGAAADVKTAPAGSSSQATAVPMYVPAPQPQPQTAPPTTPLGKGLPKKGLAPIQEK